jgi:flagellar basal-body rod modification protein FlgD
MQTLLNTNDSNTVTDPTQAIVGNTAAATQDMFTKLLVAQIQNQDPLQPTDPSQFVNQLTQLSQTESLQNLSTLTSSNSSVLQSMQVIALGAQVGSNVVATTSAVTLGTDSIAGAFTLANSSSKTTLALTGSDGVEHDIALGSVPPGNVPFTIDPATLGLAPDTYQIAVTTSSGEKPAVGIDGRLQSVQLSSTGTVVLNVSNLGQVSPSAITAFNGQLAANSSNN